MTTESPFRERELCGVCGLSEDSHRKSDGRCPIAEGIPFWPDEETRFVSNWEDSGYMGVPVRGMLNRFYAYGVRFEGQELRLEDEMNEHAAQAFVEGWDER